MTLTLLDPALSRQVLETMAADSGRHSARLERVWHGITQRGIVETPHVRAVDVWDDGRWVGRHSYPSIAALLDDGWRVIEGAGH